MVATTSDFKTIKAKVGKRAPVKANVTDTSFKAAGLHISKQVGISNNANYDDTTSSTTSTLTTRSGLSLHQLFAQFKHPTISVRISALKGFKNLVVALLPNVDAYVSDIISSLLPICCIDDDASVRKLAIQILYDLFVVQLNHVDVPSLLLPFTPYMIAMISTGLNSLDIQQQFDNTILVRYLMENFLSYESNSISTKTHQAMIQFIPPLTRLLGVVPNTTTATKTITPTSKTTNTFEAEADVATTTSWASSNNSIVQPQQHPMMIVGSMKKSKNNQKKRKRIPSQRAVPLLNNRSATIPDTSTLQPPLPPQQHVSQQDWNGTSTTNPKLMVLLSIYTLCRRRSSELDDNDTNTNYVFHNNNISNRISMTTTTQSPDVTILPQQVRRATVLFVRKNQNPMYKHSLLPSSSSSFTAAIDNTATASVSASLLLSPSEILDLLVKVRDYMIESSQNSDSYSFLYCIMTVRYIFEYYNNYCTGSTTSTAENEGQNIVHQRCYKLTSQIGSYMVESFRTYNNSSINNSNNDMAVLSRSLLCLVNTMQPLLSVSLFRNTKQGKDMVTNIKLWIELISLHVQSLLEDDEATALMMSTTRYDDQLEQSFDLSTSKEMLSVLTELLVRADLRAYFTMRTQLIELFGNVFFMKHALDDSLRDRGDQQLQPPLVLPSPILICSEVGRTAILLCCRLISMQEYDIERTTQFFGKTTTLNMLRSIPYYLLRYKSNFVAEVTVCLSTLQQIILRMDTTSNYYADMIPSLRMNIQSLLSIDSSSISDIGCSTFEMYPEVLQRQFVCFCIMSNICTTAMIQLFANICGRCYNNHPNGPQQSRVISMTMASFIVQSIHGIRKTLPMTIYIGFLVDSTGIMTMIETHPVNTKKDDIVAMSYVMDQGTRIISSCLISCGTNKVLPMLEPVFTVLLDKMIRYPISVIYMIQARTVVCLLAMFSLDLQRQNATDRVSQSIFHCTSSEFKELVVNGTICMMSSGTVQFFDDVSVVSLDRWMSPFLTIFVTEKSLFSRVVKGVLEKISEFDLVAQGHIMEIWLKVFKESQITSMLQSEGSTLMADILGNSKLRDNKDSTPVIQRMIMDLDIRCCRTKCPPII